MSRLSYWLAFLVTFSTPTYAERMLPTPRETIRVYDRIVVNTKRMISILGPITEDAMKTPIAQMKTFNSGDPVYIILDSPGGIVGPGMEFIFAMDESTAIIICVSKSTYSMAAIIATLCDHLYFYRFGSMGFHRIREGGPDGEVSTDIFVFQIYEVIASNLGISLSSLVKHLDDTWTLTAQDAVRLGIGAAIVNHIRFSPTP